LNREKNNCCGNENSDANLEQDSGYAAVSANETPSFDTPVDLHIHHVRKRSADLDGLSIKAALDGIIASGILPDDSPEWIKSIKVTSSKGSSEKTIFKFTEAKE
tara:strand:+ start:252 stop:563 length:312 start_codon:yes stop_codon:yes gene_type:complete